MFYFFKNHPFNLAKLLVTTGTSGGYNTQSEVIDLLDPTKKCQPWADYPIGVDAAAGLFVQDKMIVCGGDSTYEAGSGAVDQCFEMGPTEVVEAAILETGSYSSALGIFDQSVFLTGGFGKDLDFLRIVVQFSAYFFRW